jgi:hypothetical protein
MESGITAVLSLEPHTAMLLNLSMLMLLVALYIVCAALVHFVEGLIRPLGESQDEAQGTAHANGT